MEGDGDSSLNQHETSFQKFQSALNEDAWYKPILEKLEGLTGVKREYLVIGLGILFVINLILGVGGQIICHAVGLLYPAVQTIHVIESKNYELSFRWLMYWIVFSALNFVELFMGFLLNLIPCYWLVKCAFLIWCFSSMRVNGSMYVYSKFIYPFFMNIPMDTDILDDIIETASAAIPTAIASGVPRNLRPRRKNAKAGEE